MNTPHFDAFVVKNKTEPILDNSRTGAPCYCNKYTAFLKRQYKDFVMLRNFVAIS